MSLKTGTRAPRRKSVQCKGCDSRLSSENQRCSCLVHEANGIQGSTGVQLQCRRSRMKARYLEEDERRLSLILDHYWTHQRHTSTNNNKRVEAGRQASRASSFHKRHLASTRQEGLFFSSATHPGSTRARQLSDDPQPLRSSPFCAQGIFRTSLSSPHTSAVHLLCLPNTLHNFPTVHVRTDPEYIITCGVGQAGREGFQKTATPSIQLE